MIREGAAEMSDGTVRLREVTPADARDLFRWRMDERSRPMFRSTEPVSFDVHQAFMDRYFEPDNTDRWFVIEAEGRPVGTITLYKLSADGSEAEWGRLVVDPEQRGRGHARRALALLVALEANTAAAGVYRAAGFRPTGAQAVGDRRFVQLALSLEP